MFNVASHLGQGKAPVSVIRCGFGRSTLPRAIAAFEVY